MGVQIALVEVETQGKTRTYVLTWRLCRASPFHVWVELTGKWALPVPGVLLAWRRTDRRGWEAWVVRVESYSTGTGSEVLVSQSWVPTALVRPADGS